MHTISVQLDGLRIPPLIGELMGQLQELDNLFLLRNWSHSSNILWKVNGLQCTIPKKNELIIKFNKLNTLNNSRVRVHRKSQMLREITQSSLITSTNINTTIIN